MMHPSEPPPDVLYRWPPQPQTQPVSRGKSGMLLCHCGAHCRSTSTPVSDSPALPPFTKHSAQQRRKITRTCTSPRPYDSTSGRRPRLGVKRRSDLRTPAPLHDARNRYAAPAVRRMLLTLLRHTDSQAIVGSATDGPTRAVPRRPCWPRALASMNERCDAFVNSLSLVLACSDLLVHDGGDGVGQDGQERCPIYGPRQRRTVLIYSHQQIDEAKPEGGERRVVRFVADVRWTGRAQVHRCRR